jgi:hypothetical protein
MDHQEVQAMGAVERYLLGELDPDAREAFEAHFFDCQDCASDVRSGSIFLEHAKEVLATEPVAVAAVKERRADRRAWSAWFWPMPAGALAATGALLALTVYQGLVALPRLKSEAARAESIQGVGWSFLSVSRAAPQVITVSRAQRHIGLTLSRSSTAAFAYYRCSLSKVDGGAILSAVVAAPPGGEELQVLLPLSRLEPAEYVLVVGGMASAATDASQPEATRYHFALRYEEGAQ